MQTNETDALSFDPWYRPQDRGVIELYALERSQASEFLPYSLVHVPDAEIKLERNNHTFPTSRITCQTDDGRKYRVVQFPFDAVPAEDENRYGYQETIEGRRIYARAASADTALWSDVWWTDKEYGDVWIASEEMTIEELLRIARKILTE